MVNYKMEYWKDGILEDWVNIKWGTDEMGRCNNGCLGKC